MGSGYFKFKQFTVEQDDNVLKVSTDSVLLGSFVNDNLPAKKILDIGAGTGILTLMMAVKFLSAMIDAVEIDKHSYKWLKTNIEKTQWQSRISLHNISIEEFSEITANKYDLIISNPPFFFDMPLPDAYNKKLFKHSTGLNASKFADIIQKLLNKHGKFYTILSPAFYEKFRKESADKNLYPNSIINVRWKEEKKIERIISEFSFGIKNPLVKIFSVRNINNEYTEEYKNLTSVFYLDSHFVKT